MSCLVWQKMFCLVMHMHQHITITMQTHVLQITVLGNSKLEYSTECIFAENLIKQITHRYYISHALVHFQSPLNFSFILNVQKGLEKRFRKFDTV